MRNADLAMYQAKDGRSRARRVLRSHDAAHAGAGGGERPVQRALRRREFSLYYQPQYALARRRSSSDSRRFLRWQTPREAMRYPGGLRAGGGAERPDRRHRRLGTRGGPAMQLAEWREQGIAPPRLALNVSVQQLRHADFPKLVRTRAASAPACRPRCSSSRSPSRCSRTRKRACHAATTGRARRAPGAR